MSACEAKHQEEKNSCIEQTIEEIQSSPVWNPPAKIWQYRYNGQIVYYIPARCCDIPDVLLDENCNPIGYTNGFTGKPDSIMADFEEKRTDEKFIWEDKRTYEIDMSGIDFSNIENLYAQPLPVIQKAVQGKWKIYLIGSNGDQYTVDYPENMYIEFKKDYHVSWDSTVKPDTVYFTWKKTAIENWRDPLKGRMTYVTWEGDNTGNWYFNRIINDTLSFGGYRAPNFYRVTKIK